MTGNWLVNINNASRMISAEVSPFTGRFKVTYQGQVIHKQFMLWMLGDLYSFEKEGHSYTIRIRGMGYFGTMILLMDGVELANGEQNSPVQHMPVQNRPVEIHTPPARQAPPLAQHQHGEHDQSVEIISETNISEASDVIGVEEFPLDNRSGSKPLEVEYQVTKTITTEVNVESTLRGGAKLNANLFRIVQAELSADLTRKVGNTMGETITRRQTLSFSVGPKEMVVYKVIWKQKTRRGEYITLVNGAEVTIPYTLRYDLTCEVKC